MRAGKAVTLTLGAAAAAGAAVGFYLVRRRHAAEDPERQSEELAWRVRVRLAEDGLTDRGTLRVAALTPRIVELTGTVEREEEAHRAVERAQGVAGVTTVVNRIEVTERDARLERNRTRYDEGSPELTERHWYGQRVGTGARRQSDDTDPDRPSDKVPMVDRQLGTGAAQDLASEPLDKVAPAVTDHTPRPTGTSRPRGKGRKGGPADSDIVEPASEEGGEAFAGVEPELKPGVERAIEEAGLRREGEEGEGG